MGLFQDVSEGIADAVAAVGPSVVEVRGRRRPASGVVVAAERVVTASHVVTRDAEVVVVGEDGVERPATLVGRDPATDLALLKVEGLTAPAITWSDAAKVRVGALVLPAARLGRGVRVVLGVVSGVGGAWKTALGGDVDRWVDVHADLPPGFSGGPLVDASGGAVGVNTRGLTPHGAVLPGAVVARVAARIEATGPVPPGYLGVGFYPAGSPEQLVVVSVEPGGPGDAAGVQVGDVLSRFDGVAVEGIRHLLGLLGARGAGAAVTLAITRGGDPREVAITLAQRPARLGCR